MVDSGHGPSQATPPRRARHKVGSTHPARTRLTARTEVAPAEVAIEAAITDAPIHEQAHEQAHAIAMVPRHDANTSGTTAIGRKARAISCATLKKSESMYHAP